MTIPLIFFALLSPFALDFTSAIQKMTQPFQAYCVQRVRTYALPTTTEGIVCGSTQILPDERKDFLKVGIYHVLVVSGAHFLTLDRLTAGLPAPLRILSLLFFFLISGGSAPALRAFIHLGLNMLSTTLRLHWSWVDRLILSTSLVLSLFCSLFSTRSLLLSVICATVFSWPTRTGDKTTTFLWVVSKTIFVSLIAGAVMASESVTHPLGWFVGSLLSPIVGSILFPLLLFNWLLPDLNLWVLPIMEKIIQLINTLSSMIPENMSGTAVPSQLCWALVFTVLLIFKFRLRAP